MMQVCRDASDAVALYLPQRLYLKSFAKLNISVQLPSQKVYGKSISNWELMEKLRKMIHPDSFSLLKVTKSGPDLIRFDAELENRDKLERVISRLEDRIIQLNDYPDPLKVKVSETKSEYPSRHSWDSFFRDATDMDEMKPGERPDTVHICYIPIRWFVHDKDRDENAPPSESIFRKAFEKYGTIRQVDIPAADPFRLQMKAAMRGITIPLQDSNLYFEGYIQYSEYVSFVRCMDALRNRKLLRKKDDIAEWCTITVDFDKTKHMTDAAVKRRSIVRQRLVARHRAKEEEENAEKEKNAKKEARERQKYERAEREKLEKMREREERRKKKQLAKLMERDNVDLNSKVAEERKKLLKAQKKLQAVRLIEELFKRIELRPDLQRNGEAHHRYYHAAGERSARARIVDKFKKQHEDALETQREQLKQAIDGRIVIRSALETKKPKREMSVSSISSNESRGEKNVKTEKLTTPEREAEYKNHTGMYGMPAPYGYGYPVPSPFAQTHGFPFPPSLYYPRPGMYYAPPVEYAPRRPRGRGRGRGRGPRMPYFDGPDASQQYYKYFKKLTEAESRTERSRSRSRRRSYSRSRSRSRSRSHTRHRSYSHGRRSRSRSRRSRSRSRRSRSRSYRSISRYYSRSRSRSRKRSRTRSMSRSHHPRSRTKSKHRSSRHRHMNEEPNGVDPVNRKLVTPDNNRTREKSKSWSLPKEGDARKSWSKSPKDM